MEVIAEIWAQLKKGKLTSKEQAVALRNKLQTDTPALKKPAAVATMTESFRIATAAAPTMAPFASAFDSSLFSAARDGSVARC